MKKILISIIISSISLSTLAGGVFNMPIPQPDFISNDWDGDGIINSLDDDDDNDGIKDVDDSTPFGRNISSKVVNEKPMPENAIYKTITLGEKNSYYGYHDQSWTGTNYGKILDGRKLGDDNYLQNISYDNYSGGNHFRVYTNRTNNSLKFIESLDAVWIDDKRYDFSKSIHSQGRNYRLAYIIVPSDEILFNEENIGKDFELIFEISSE